MRMSEAVEQKTERERGTLRTVTVESKPGLKTWSAELKLGL